MRRRTVLLIVAAAACSALAAGPAAGARAGTAAGPPAAAGTGTGQAAGQLAGPAGHWGHAIPLPGLKMLASGSNAVVESMSCGSPGNCVAAGSFGGLLQPHAFYAEEKDGVWGPAKLVVGSTVSDLVSVSCSDAADCVAVGYWAPGLTGFPDEIPLVFNKVDGVWGFTSEPLPPGSGDSRAASVSCPPQSPENCTMGGWFIDANGVQQPFTADEHDGLWGPEQLAGALHQANVGPDTTVSSVSCGSPGNCAAVGHYTARGGGLRAFVMDEFNGLWTLAHAIPLLETLTSSDSQADAVSCATAGNCALAGEYRDSQGVPHVFVINEEDGEWIRPQPVPGLAVSGSDAMSFPGAVSCGARGSCAVAGGYIVNTRNGTTDGFVAESKGGVWQPAITIAGSSVSVDGLAGSAGPVSCASAGNCAVGGSITDSGGIHPMVLSERNGTWGHPHLFRIAGEVKGDQLAAVLAVSCVSLGNCAAGGSYGDKPFDEQGFVADESTATKAALKLSAARVKFGHEHTEKLTVTVEPRTGGTPTGKVTVAAGLAALCTIKLANGTGSCTLAARRLKPGKYRLTGTYGGDRTYQGSAYPAETLIVVR